VERVFWLIIVFPQDNNERRVMTQILKQFQERPRAVGIRIDGVKTTIQWSDGYPTISRPNPDDEPNATIEQGVLWALAKKYLSSEDILGFLSDKVNLETGALFYLLHDFMETGEIQEVLSAGRDSIK
jgi:hypothetical protein